MKINRINTNRNISFSGIRSPYKLPNGTKVTPISQDPTERDIAESISISANTNNSSMQGLNGYVFPLGQDLVVKKYKGKQAISDDPYREINLLDKMYDHNLRFPNSQVGCYAFETPNGQTYLVSTKVEGENPNVATESLFTKENLRNLTDIILQMDMGSTIKNSSPHGFSDRCRFMNYDFNGGNIKITPSKAGLFDFEYDKFENIDEQIYANIVNPNVGYNCNQSDTSALPCCMRSFEYWTLCDYLRTIDSPNEIFNDYLEIKGNYHRQMADFYLNFTQESSFPEIVLDIAKKEAVHSKLLKKDETGEIPTDIMNAEARKIQMANFLHEQGIFNATGIINPRQLYKYTQDTLKLFNKQLQKAEEEGDTNRIIYYKDGLELIQQWSNVNRGLGYNIQRRDPDTIKKITNQHITTLDEVLKRSTLPEEIKSKIPEGKSITEILDLARKEKKVIGRGANSVVYEIPILNGYVLKVLNKDDPNKINIAEFPSKRNLGQPVWQSKQNPRFLILKKVTGEEHSVNNWSGIIWDKEAKAPKQVTEAQAINFSSKVSEIAQMRQEAYNSLAKDVKTLDDMGYKVDSINPNNLIVDTAKQQMHIIDYFKVKPHELSVYRNCATDITSLMLDFTLFPEFYDKLSPEKQAELITNVEKINKKVIKASLKAGLPADSQRYITYIRETSKWFPTVNVPKENGEGEYIRIYDKRLDDFIDMLENPQKWAMARK